MTLVGVTSIGIKVGYLKACVWFGVIDGLEVPEIIGTSFIDRLVKEICIAERNIVQKNPRPVEILATTTFYEKPKTVTEENTALKVSEEEEDIEKVNSYEDDTEIWIQI